MHVVNIITVFMNQFFPNALGVCKYTMNTCVTLTYVVIMVYISMEFFAKEDDTETEKGPSVDEVDAVEEPHEYNAEMLRGWYAIEVLMFMGNIFSNIIFILTRACSRIRILSLRTLTVAQLNTDMIEE